MFYFLVFITCSIFLKTCSKMIHKKMSIKDEKELKEMESEEEDDVIIPNSHIEAHFGSLISFPTTIQKFEDYCVGFSKNRIVMAEGINVFIRILEIEFKAKDSVFFCRTKQLENGFCFYEFLIESKKYNFQAVVIVYIANNMQFKYYLPLSGNSINRLTGKIISGDDDDKFWLWEETHCGQKRPHGPIDVSDDQFKNICISFAMIEKEIEDMVVVKPKNSVSKQEMENDKGILLSKIQY